MKQLIDIINEKLRISSKKYKQYNQEVFTLDEFYDYIESETNEKFTEDQRGEIQNIIYIYTKGKSYMHEEKVEIHSVTDNNDEQEYIKNLINNFNTEKVQRYYGLNSNRFSSDKFVIKYSNQNHRLYIRRLRFAIFNNMNDIQIFTVNLKK